MAVIIKNYDSKTWPHRAEEILQEDADKLVKSGAATLSHDGIYVTKVMEPEKKVMEVKEVPEFDPLSIDCPRCNALPGDPCQTPSGADTSPHSARAQ